MALIPVIDCRSIAERARSSVALFWSIKAARRQFRRNGAATLIVAIMVVGLALRLAWMSGRSIIIENEGGEYAASADHILRGVGYVGQGQLPGEPQLFFPPGYPSIKTRAVQIPVRR
jgi:hypothetical protein